MKARATILCRVMALVLVAGAILPLARIAVAQTSLGNEFIVFVEGKNVLVPFFDGTAVADPLTADNTIARFPYSDWAAPGFRWDNETGVDMTGMVGASVEAGGATMYIKLLVDAANAGAHPCGAGTGDDCLSLTLFDGFTGNQAGDNLEGRLKWFVPDSMRDGKWHNLAIPFPPSTVGALDSAKVGKKVDGSALATPLDPLAKNWEYTGGWAGGWGWGGTSGSPHGTTDTNWQDFEWNNVRGLSVHYDWAGGGGDVFIDDLYFGSSSTDLSSATSAPSAMSGVTFAASGKMNKVSWSPNADYGGYRVYVDEAEITQARLGPGGLNSFAEVAFNASSFEVTHQFEVPHGSMSPFPLYYAVTSLNLFGVENTDVSASAGLISNPDISEQAYIVELTDAEANAVFNNLSGGTVNDDPFPARTIPFMVDSTHWKSGDGAVLPATPEDLHAKVKMGFNRSFNELYVYAEVTDDVVARHPGTDACNGCNTWAYDSFEIGWGSYDVRDVTGGSILGGSPHENYQRADAPDYQMRFAWLGDDASPDPRSASTFIGTLDGNGNEGEIPGGGTVYADLKDASGATIGYKFLTLVPFAGFVFAPTGDQVFVPPAQDKLKLIPMNIAINDGDDQDAQNPRDLQVQWSTKPSANGQWWNTPSQWLTVAVVGANVTATDTEDEIALPNAFELEQNYPNPFNPTTSIQFSLAQTENVHLSVFNVLGQKVATLIRGAQMSPGKHSIRFDAKELASGMYIYRIEAGSYTKTLSMMLLK